MNTEVWWHHTWLFLLLFSFAWFHFSSFLHPFQHLPPPKILLGVADINNLVCFFLHFSPYSACRLLYRHVCLYISIHVPKWEGGLSLFYVIGLYFRCFKSFLHLTIPDGNPSNSVGVTLLYTLKWMRTISWHGRAIIYAAIQWETGSIWFIDYLFLRKRVAEHSLILQPNEVVFIYHLPLRPVPHQGVHTSLLVLGVSTLPIEFESTWFSICHLNGIWGF